MCRGVVWRWFKVQLARCGVDRGRHSLAWRAAVYYGDVRGEVIRYWNARMGALRLGKPLGSRIMRATAVIET